MDKVLTNIISEVALRNGVEASEVEKIFTMPYKLIREKIQALELHGHLYDEVKDLDINFNMPVLFKMYLNEYKLNKFNSKEDDKESTED